MERLRIGRRTDATSSVLGFRGKVSVALKEREREKIAHELREAGLARVVRLWNGVAPGRPKESFGSSRVLASPAAEASTRLSASSAMVSVAATLMGAEHGLAAPIHDFLARALSASGFRAGRGVPVGLLGAQTAPSQRPAHELAKGPLGTTQYPNADQLLGAYAAKDRRSLTVSDEVLVELARSGATSFGPESTLDNFPASLAPDATRFLARVEELRCAQVIREPDAIAALTSTLEGLSRDADAPEALDAMWRFAVALRLDPAAIRFNGRPLAEQPPRSYPERRTHPLALRRTQGATLPVGEGRPDLKRQFEMQHVAPDPRVFELSDTALTFSGRFIQNSSFTGAASAPPSPATRREFMASALAACMRGVELGHKGLAEKYVSLLTEWEAALKADPSILASANERLRSAPRGIAIAEGFDAMSKVGTRSRRPDDARDVLERLLCGHTEVHEFPALCSEALRRRMENRFRPLGFDDLPSSERTQFVERAFSTWENAEASAVLAGLLTKLPEDEIARMLRRKDYGPADEFAAASAALSRLDGTKLAFATADIAGDPEHPDFTTLPLRIELTRSDVDEAFLVDLAARRGRSDPSGYLRALVDRIAVEDDPRPLGELVRRLAERDGWFRHAEALSNAAVELFAPELFRAVSRAVGLSPKQVSPLAGEIGHEIRRCSSTLKEASLVEWVLEAFAEADGQRERRSVARARGREGPGVEFKGESAGIDTAIVRGPSSVRILGFELPVNQTSPESRVSVPTAREARFALTPTAVENLKPLLAHWVSDDFALGILGDSGVAKTSAIRFLCHLDQSNYRRIVVAEDTELDDLVGKWVGGERLYSLADLKRLSSEELGRIATKDFLLDPSLGRSELTEQILLLQEKPRWVDGPVTVGLLDGDKVVLDEYLAARPRMREAFNGLLDDRNELVIVGRPKGTIDGRPGGVRVKPRDGAKLFMCSNDESHVGRAPLSRAEKRRWTPIYFKPYQQVDYALMLQTFYADLIPKEQRTGLAYAVALIAETARPESARISDSMRVAGTQIGRDAGGVVFTPRDLFKIAERVVRFEGELPPRELMRREAEEILTGSLRSDEDKRVAKAILDAALPYDGRDFYADLRCEETETHFIVGGAALPKKNAEHELRPGKSESELTLTPRTLKGLYLLAKAVMMGENAFLEGEAGGGKTAIPQMLAAEVERPFSRHVVAGADAYDAIGMYGEAGWQDGYFLGATGYEDGVPHILLQDEIPLASARLLVRLNSALDDERVLVLQERKGQKVVLPRDFVVIAAGNPPTRAYGAVKKLAPSERNRYTVIQIEPAVEADELLTILRERAMRLRLERPAILVPALVELHRWVVESTALDAQGYEDRDASDRLGEESPESVFPDRSISSLRRALDMLARLQKGGTSDAAAFRLAAERFYVEPWRELPDKEKVLARLERVLERGAEEISWDDAIPHVPVVRPHRGAASPRGRPRASREGEPSVRTST